MHVTLESLAARLDRIESALKSRRPTRAAYTPREFAKLIGRSYRWTVDQCAARTVRTVRPKPPYLIPAAELERFSTGRRAITE